MIARGLLEQGKEVRVLVRRDSPSSQLVQRGLATSAETLIETGAQPVHGDLRDRASLDAALEGVETVISTANSALRGGADNPQSVDLDGNRNLIEGARDAGVEHFVFVSLLGAAPDHPAPFLRAKGQSEASLRESGMGYTILAPTAFMELWASMVVGMPALQGQPVTLVGEGRRRHSFVSNRNVAAFAVNAVDNPAALNRHLAIGGPEALTWREVVATYERALERSIPVKFVAMGEPVPGLPEPMPVMLAGMETYDSVVEMEETSRTFGVPLTTLEMFVKEQVATQIA
jgi:NADH dehydrogenase